MSRRRAATKREIIPEPKYGDILLSKFINKIMYDGKKSVAEAIVYSAVDNLKKKDKLTQIELFRMAINNVKPDLEVRSRRVGGATYQVPVEVRPERQEALAIRWIIESSRKRSENSMDLRLARELNDCIDNRGAAIKKKEDTHKMAEANRAFAHFRW